MDVNSNERRRQTRSNVYHYLYGAQEFCTRQSLAQALDLSLPTIYQNLTDLVDAGLVRYAGQSQSTGGRKASGLAIVPDARVAVGIALTEDRLRFSAADLRLNEIAYHKVSHTSNFEMEELGTLETPIALTNTLNVGKVHDAMVSVMLDWCRRDRVKLTSVNPVVLECNDSSISDIARRPVGEAEVRAAIAAASADFAEGDVGAGRGTICYGMKGGIGSASRQMTLGDETFTLGVLVQSNYGASADFQWAQLPEGLAECDRGSIIMVVATDLPLSHRQLRRVIKRASVGMARLGSYVGHGSGEIMVGFTTAPRAVSGAFETMRVLREEEINLPFRAVGECCEEAILKSMLCARAGKTLDGEAVPALSDLLAERKQP